MLRKMLLTASCMAAAAAATATAEDAPLLANIFGDNMVIQRDAPVAFWGDAEPGEKITVTFAGKKKTVTAGKDGSWRAELAAVSAPGPYSLSVSGSSSGTAEAENIAAGDVWLCSGQSNMAFGLRSAMMGGFFAASANDPSIRLLKVQQDNTAAPRRNFKADIAPEWQPVTPESAGGFSAVCYFFAQSIKRDIDVPLGLIDSSWGGSQIEAWISTDSLRKTGLVDEQLDLMKVFTDDPRGGVEILGGRYEDWWNDSLPDDANAWEADAAAISSWQEAPAEMRSWTEWGMDSMASYTGTVLFGNSFTVPAARAGEPAKLSIGGIDEFDVTWVNGEFIDSTFGWGTPRTYDIPAGVLKEGENTVVISLYNSWGAGGMTGPNDVVAVKFEGGDDIPLADGWTYRTVAVGDPPRAPWESVSGLTGISNGMIAPLGDMKMKGALWYQGESDTGEPDTYDDYLAALMDDWRGRFGSDMSFYAIQLANYGPYQESPVESGWAKVRDAQRSVTAADGNAGSVVTIDVGNPFDIHPTDKRTVGERAAKLAKKITYGLEGLKTGPAPVAATREGSDIKVSFAEVDDGLMSVSGSPAAFELCAEGTCRMAETSISGDAIILKDGGDADHVRYCWADSPICNVFDGKSQPATPFEIAIEN